MCRARRRNFQDCRSRSAPRRRWWTCIRWPGVITFWGRPARFRNGRPSTATSRCFTSRAGTRRLNWKSSRWRACTPFPDGYFCPFAHSARFGGFRILLPDKMIRDDFSEASFPVSPGWLKRSLSRSIDPYAIPVPGARAVRKRRRSGEFLDFSSEKPRSEQRPWRVLSPSSI